MPISDAAAGLAGFGPALGERQRAGAEGPPFALSWPWPAGRLNAVPRQARAQRRDQQGAHPVSATLRLGVGLRVDQQWIADLIPGERNLLTARRHALCPKMVRVAR